MQEVLDATEELYDAFLGVDCAASGNLQRVQAAMADENVGPHHFAGSTGYGYGDLGRTAYDQVCCSAMPARGVCAINLLFLGCFMKRPRSKALECYNCSASFSVPLFFCHGCCLVALSMALLNSTGQQSP
ncbi:MAG: hypothetical protein HC767_08735 [Akkermansiaceae bacterium]|nr:hypothetical protein [Akkermansiaceae bacterium]